MGENVPLVTSPTGVSSAAETVMCARGIPRSSATRPRSTRAGPADAQPAASPSPEGRLGPPDGPAHPGLHRADGGERSCPWSGIAHLGPQRVPGAEPARPRTQRPPAASSASQSAAGRSTSAAAHNRARPCIRSGRRRPDARATARRSTPCRSRSLGSPTASSSAGIEVPAPRARRTSRAGRPPRPPPAQTPRDGERPRRCWRRSGRGTPPRTSGDRR